MKRQHLDFEQDLENKAKHQRTDTSLEPCVFAFSEDKLETLMYGTSFANHLDIKTVGRLRRTSKQWATFFSTDGELYWSYLIKRDFPKSKEHLDTLIKYFNGKDPNQILNFELVYSLLMELHSPAVREFIPDTMFDGFYFLPENYPTVLLLCMDTAEIPEFATDESYEWLKFAIMIHRNDVAIEIAEEFAIEEDEDILTICAAANNTEMYNYYSKPSSLTLTQFINEGHLQIPTRENRHEESAIGVAISKNNINEVKALLEENPALRDVNIAIPSQQTAMIAFLCHPKENILNVSVEGNRLDYGYRVAESADFFRFAIEYLINGNMKEAKNKFIESASRSIRQFFLYATHTLIDTSHNRLSSNNLKHLYTFMSLIYEDFEPSPNEKIAIKNYLLPVVERLKKQNKLDEAQAFIDGFQLETNIDTRMERKIDEQKESLHRKF